MIRPAVGNSNEKGLQMKRFAIAVAAVVVLGVAPAALASGGLSGKYKTKISHSSALGGGLNGTWVIHFTSGHFSAADNGHVAAQGTDSISGHTITFPRSTKPSGCHSKGKYKFKLTGSKLKFTRISDGSGSNCIGRKVVLSHTFHKVVSLHGGY